MVVKRKRAPNAKATPSCDLMHPFPGFGTKLTVEAARRFLDRDADGFDGFLWFLRTAAKAAKTQDEKSACDAYLEVLTYAIHGAQLAVQKRAPVRVEVVDWGAAEHARVVALVLRAHARADDDGDGSFQRAEREAFSELLVELLEGIHRKAVAEKDARIKAKPSRNDLFNQSADLGEAADKLRKEAEREEDEQLERLRPLVAAALAPKRARAERLDYAAAEIAWKHFNGPKPKPLPEEVLAISLGASDVEPLGIGAKLGGWRARSIGAREHA